MQGGSSFFSQTSLKTAFLTCSEMCLHAESKSGLDDRKELPSRLVSPRPKEEASLGWITWWETLCLSLGGVSITQELARFL